MNNRQQSGRRRGRGGQRPQGGQGRPEQGNRIDNRARGNAAQLLEKYKSLARDAQTQGDRVMTEYYLQFADHYFRVLSESRARFEENRRQRDDADDGYDADDARDGADENERGEDEDRAPRRERFERRPREQVESREDAQGEAEEPAQEARAERRPRGGLKPRRNGAMNGHEEEAGHGIEADRLPPSFGPREEDKAEDAPAEAPAPKRRGRPRKVVEASERSAES